MDNEELDETIEDEPIEDEINEDEPIEEPHAPAYECEYCDEGFDRAIDKANHMRIVHKDIIKAKKAGVAPIPAVTSPTRGPVSRAYRAPAPARSLGSAELDRMIDEDMLRARKMFMVSMYMNAAAGGKQMTPPSNTSLSEVTGLVKEVMGVLAQPEPPTEGAPVPGTAPQAPPNPIGSMIQGFMTNPEALSGLVKAGAGFIKGALNGLGANSSTSSQTNDF